MGHSAREFAEGVDATEGNGDLKDAAPGGKETRGKDERTRGPVNEKSKGRVDERTRGGIL